MKICFDMDGTIADLYGVDGWLNYLIAEDIRPYKEAKPIVNMNVLARRLNALQRAGHSQPPSQKTGCSPCPSSAE